ncbi:hypothetical protein [Pelistega ratti]|uniref:hypothetical protein n=1 Tax=Pelistega ratti TaxID=2652177 RepID=UPI00135B6BA1|nr:hypothetical protein [Pelistega ratti]
MKFIKDGFIGAPNGSIYPIVFSAGEECPEELLLAAVEKGFIDQGKQSDGKQGNLLDPHQSGEDKTTE